MSETVEYRVFRPDGVGHGGLYSDIADAEREAYVMRNWSGKNYTVKQRKVVRTEWTEPDAD